MRVAIYARTSKAEGDDETSIPVQIADCKDRAEDEGWEVVGPFTDVGISGWRRKVRPAYEEVFALAEQGKIDAVLVRDYERLLRNDKEGARWLELFEQRGFSRFVFADEADINLGRARDRKDFKDRVSAAVYYSDRLSEKVRKSKAAAKAHGVYTGGESEPYGYRRVDGALQVDPKEAAVLHAAVARLAEGSTLGRITRDLNGQGVRTSKGAIWRPKSLRRTLVSEHLTGARGYPRILSDEEAAVAQHVLVELHVPAPGHPSGLRHPLSGPTICGSCGSKLAGNVDKYKCSTSTGGCAGISVLAFPLEQYVLMEALVHFLETRDTAAPQEEAPAPDPGALQELREVEQAITETRELVGSGGMRPADAAPILAALAERQQRAADAIAANVRTAPALPVKRLSEVFTPDELIAVGLERHADPKHRADATKFRAAWEARDPQAVQVVRDLVATQVERITVNRRERRGRGFDPDRVTIEWVAR